MCIRDSCVPTPVFFCSGTGNLRLAFLGLTPAEVAALRAVLCFFFLANRMGAQTLSSATDRLPLACQRFPVYLFSLFSNFSPIIRCFHMLSASFGFYLEFVQAIEGLKKLFFQVSLVAGPIEGAELAVTQHLTGGSDIACQNRHAQRQHFQYHNGQSLQHGRQNEKPRVSGKLCEQFALHVAREYHTAGIPVSYTHLTLPTILRV